MLHLRCQAVLAVFAIACSQQGLAEQSLGGCTPDEQQILSAADAAAQDNFSSDVAISGQTAVLSAPFKETAGQLYAGAAYVFAKTNGKGTEQWSQQINLVAPDAAAEDVFGASVAIDGSTIVIGAPGRDVPHTDSGAAYVFTLVEQDGAQSWIHQATLTASDPGVNDEFGNDVAIEGDRIVIGAWLANNAVYVFERSNDGWIEQAKIESPAEPFTTSVFGRSVALWGDTIAVGDIGAEVDDISYAGAVYIFVRQGEQWVQQTKLDNPHPEFGDSVGDDIALEGDTLLVGASSDNPGGMANAGTTFVYQRTAGVWKLAAELNSSDAATGVGFGGALALSGNWALIGARSDDHSGQINIGSVYVFIHASDEWVEHSKFSGSDSSDGDQFGNALALEGNAAIIGSFGAEFANQEDSGAAYAFRIGCAPGDITEDGAVNVDDLLTVINLWGNCPDPPAKCPADLNDDGTVNVDDLLIVINNWS